MHNYTNRPQSHYSRGFMEHKPKSKWVFGKKEFATLKALDKWCVDNPVEFEEITHHIKKYLVAARSGVPESELGW